MQAKKNPGATAAKSEGRGGHALAPLRLLAVAVVACLAAGCGPPGPRALIDGRHQLAQGHYQQAIDRLKSATALLPTNALAWNELGLAFHYAGLNGDAEIAYQRALKLDSDLVEARYNLGCLWLGQNRLDQAKAAFTGFVLRRGDSVDSLMRLGDIALRSRDWSGAERSFSEALRIKPQNAEAWNGFGVAAINQQRTRASEAAQCFNRALSLQPSCRPALLNLAIVSHQYLNARPQALQKYREYLATTPLPNDAAAVSATAKQLEEELAPPPRQQAVAPPTQPKTNTVQNVAAPAGTNRQAVAAKPEVLTNQPRIAAVTSAPAITSTPPNSLPAQPLPAPARTTEVVQLPAEPVYKAAQDFPSRASSPAPQAPARQTAKDNTAELVPPLTSTNDSASHRNFLQRVNPLNLFHGQPRTAERAAPPPPAAATTDPKDSSFTVAANTTSAPKSSQSPAPIASYVYKAPAKPAAGDHESAQRVFDKGVQMQKARRLNEAIAAYRQAIQLDPGYFQAQFNLALAAADSGEIPLALTAGEWALAIRPDSLDARYNFALALQRGGYFGDAANELEHVVAADSNEVRAHLALGNLYAGPLHQIGKAREHYLIVLDKSPHHPEAQKIRFWLAGNPG